MTDILPLIAQVLQVRPADLSEDDGVQTMPQWDSLKIILLASMIEVTHGITLSSEDIEQLTSVGAVRAVVARHGIG
ncbi:acyl carrier protein [Ramlibacter sp.]|uniref:acyl carrier protein n=1 Tax=Ramlibacter sp. TaxID=1917967 RepID=UPI002FC5C69C